MKLLVNHDNIQLGNISYFNHNIAYKDTGDTISPSRIRCCLLSFVSCDHINDSGVDGERDLSSSIVYLMRHGMCVLGLVMADGVIDVPESYCVKFKVYH